MKVTVGNKEYVILPLLGGQVAAWMCIEHEGNE